MNIRSDMQEKHHYYYMEQALKQAYRALQRDEVPVGAVVVDNKGTIIGRGYNCVEQKKQQTAHAEVIAINKACKKIQDWRLNGCSVYITLEPCMMCMGLMYLSRIDAIIFGASSKLFAFRLDKKGQSSLYNRDIEIQGGVLDDDAVMVLQQFFKQKRNKT